MLVSNNFLIFVFVGYILKNHSVRSAECFSKSSDYCGSLSIGRKLNTTLGALVCQNGLSTISNSNIARFDEISRGLADNPTVIVRSNHFMEICGFTRNSGSAYDKGECEKFGCINVKVYAEGKEPDIARCVYKPLGPYSMDYEMTSLSCCQPDDSQPSCKKSLENSTTTNCAMLYKLENCKQCSWEQIPLQQGREYNTLNAAVIRSLNVIEGCVVTMRTFGSLGIAKNESRQFTSFERSLEPSYYKDGEVFTCSCRSSDNSPQTETEVSDMSVFKIVGVAIGIVSLVLISVGVLWFRKYRNRNSAVNGGESIYLQVAQYLNNEMDIQRDSLEFDPDNPETIIGQGGFGKVFKGKLKVRNQFVAVAIKVASSTEDVQCLKNEIKILKFLGHHPNIVHFAGACSTNNEIGDQFCVMELCELGCLKNYLSLMNRTTYAVQIASGMDPQEHIPGYYPVFETRKRISSVSMEVFTRLVTWSKEIASGMDYLSYKNVLHVDLAARNVLLTNEKVAKIGDFGLSKKLYAPHNYDRIVNGFAPVKWVALECLTDSKYSVKSDVWAYGVTVWEIFTLGSEPYVGQSFQQVFNFLRSGNRLSFPRFATQEIHAQILSCWEENPELRPHFSELDIFFGKMVNADSNGG